jgi:hypothetical protein
MLISNQSLCPLPISLQERAETYRSLPRVFTHRFTASNIPEYSRDKILYYCGGK